MKQVILSVLLSLVFCLLGLTCKDKLDTSCDTNFLEADVNGYLWEAMTVKALKGGIGSQISIIAEADYGDTKMITFGLPCDIKTGDYDLTLTPGVWDYGAYIYPKSGGLFYSEAGNMNVAVHDTSTRILKGTFEFVAAFGDASVTKGSFCVKY